MKLPRDIDKSTSLGPISLEELVIVGLACCLGILTEHIMYTLLGAVLLAAFFRKYRDSKPEGFLLHLMYWYGLAPVKATTVPNPFEREVLPP